MRLPITAAAWRNCATPILTWTLVLAISPNTLTAQTAYQKDAPQTPAKQSDKQNAPPSTSGQDKKATGTDAAPPPEGDRFPPGVTGGTPTITDTATLSPPGWIECDPGSLKNLNRDRILGTPVLFKLTSGNRRLEYRIASDGYIRQGDRADGIGNTYLGLHYLLAAQEKVGYDVAARFTLTVPTARPALGGSRKFDYTGLLLASRDFTKWGFHGDFNAGLASLTRPSAPGADIQYLLAGSTTSPIRGGRWQYTNELVYLSPILGQAGRLTTMHGFAYSVHRYELYSAALQWQLHGDGATLQVLVAGSFFLSKVF